jgi:hypothetical protein
MQKEELRTAPAVGAFDNLSPNLVSAHGFAMLILEIFRKQII